MSNTKKHHIYSHYVIIPINTEKLDECHNQRKKNKLIMFIIKNLEFLYGQYHNIKIAMMGKNAKYYDDLYDLNSFVINSSFINYALAANILVEEIKKSFDEYDYDKCILSFTELLYFFSNETIRIKTADIDFNNSFIKTPIYKDTIKEFYLMNNMRPHASMKAKINKMEKQNKLEEIIPSVLSISLKQFEEIDGLEQSYFTGLTLNHAIEKLEKHHKLEKLELTRGILIDDFDSTYKQVLSYEKNRLDNEISYELHTPNNLELRKADYRLAAKIYKDKKGIPAIKDNPGKKPRRLNRYINDFNMSDKDYFKRLNK